MSSQAEANFRARAGTAGTMTGLVIAEPWLTMAGARVMPGAPAAPAR
jgi:hypothetical protein